MTARRVLAAFHAVASIGVVVFLWRFWTPRCNESCSDWLVISIYGGFVVIIVSAFTVAALTLSGRLTSKASIGAFMVGALIVVAWTGFAANAASSRGEKSSTSVGQFAEPSRS